MKNGFTKGVNVDIEHKGDKQADSNHYFQDDRYSRMHTDISYLIDRLFYDLLPFQLVVPTKPRGPIREL